MHSPTSGLRGISNFNLTSMIKAWEYAWPRMCVPSYLLVSDCKVSLQRRQKVGLGDVQQVERGDNEQWAGPRVDRP